MPTVAAGVPIAPARPHPLPLVHRRKRPWAESAAVVIENATGHIVALAGGYDVGLEGFVRATQAKRQPGSSFKPFVYASALASGMRQTDVVVDAPFSVLGTNGLPWSPRNYDGEYRGPILLRKALALSLNTVAVRLAHTTGIEAVTTLATRLGVRTPLRNDLTVALGSSEITPMDVALGYSSLARMGVHIDPVWITSVADRRGRVLGTAGAPLSVPGAPANALPGGPGTRAMDAGTAYVMVDMMRNVFYAGTAKKGQREGMDFGGKTGTTSGFVDAWFVGFSPRYTVAVWVGTDGTASIGDKETGGKAALPVWSAIMEALPNVPGERFPVPDEVLLLPAPEGTAGTEWLGYVRGTAPPELLEVPALLDAAMLPPFGGAYPVAGRSGVDGAEEAPAAQAQDPIVETLPDDTDEDVEAGAADPFTGWPQETVLDARERPATEGAASDPSPRPSRDPFAGALTADEPPPTAPAAAAAPKVVKAPPATSRKTTKRPRKKRRGD